MLLDIEFPYLVPGRQGRLPYKLFSVRSFEVEEAPVAPVPAFVHCLSGCLAQWVRLDGVFAKGAFDPPVDMRYRRDEATFLGHSVEDARRQFLGFSRQGVLSATPYAAAMLGAAVRIAGASSFEPETSQAPAFLRRPDVVAAREARAEIVRRAVERLFVADGLLFRRLPLPVFEVCLPGGRLDKRKTGRAVKIPHVTLRLLDQDNPGPLKEALLDDRIFGLNEREAAEARAREIGRRIQSAEHLELQPEGRIGLPDLSALALRVAGRDLIGTVGGPQAFGGDSDFRKAALSFASASADPAANAAALAPLARSLIASFDGSRASHAAALEPDVAARIARLEAAERRALSRMRAGVISSGDARLTAVDDAAMGEIADQGTSTFSPR